MVNEQKKQQNLTSNFKSEEVWQQRKLHCKIIHAHTYCACWVTTASVCMCGWLFLKRERVFCSISLCVSLFDAIWTSMQKHCYCALRPTGVAMVTAVITKPVLLTDVNTGKRVLSFWESCRILNSTVFFLFFFSF